MNLPDTILKEIFEHGIDGYPDECCGVVFSPKNAPDKFTRTRRCNNVQNKYHELDPKRFPRTARTAYLIDGKELFDIEKQSRDSGEFMSVIYHSHCDTTAYFSDEDIKQATFEGEPIYPNVAYVVMSVIDNEVRDSKTFIWSETSKSFVEQ